MNGNNHSDLCDSSSVRSILDEKMKEVTFTKQVLKFIYMEKFNKLFYHHLRVDTCSFSFALRDAKNSKKGLL